MSVLPRIALFLQYVLPRNSRNTQNLLAVCSPTDCTDFHRTFLPYILPQNSRNTQNLLAVYSPTDCTDFHRTFLLYVLPRNSRNTQNLLAVCSPTEFTERTEPSCCMFSHGIHGTHRIFLLYILPQIAQIFTDAAFKGVHLSQVHQPVLLLHFLLCWCTSCSVGALETSAPPERTYLCRSVKSVGEYFQQPLP